MSQPMQAGQFFDVRISRNRISAFGDLRLVSFSRLISAIHQVINKSGYPDAVIDFNSLTSITASVVPPLAAYLRLLVRDRKAEFEYIEPRNPQLANRIVKMGLAHYIEHRRFTKPKLNSSDASVIQYLDQDEREFAVDKVLNSALRKTDLKRQHLAALEWAVNEITDNVLTHSNSNVGGFLVCQKLSHHNILEFTVADGGMGVARSLGITDDNEALERSIQEGVTRNKSTNQGNGLFGTYQIALASAGIFAMRSGCGNLYVTKGGEMHVRRDSVPYRGTFVVCQIDCDNPTLVERALTIGGRTHIPPYDYIERKHEVNAQNLKVSAREICHTFGSRQSGIEARRYIKNLLDERSGLKIEIDFDSVYVVSSSFADEVFGKLFVEFGPLRYMRSITLLNVVPTVEGLIDRAITLRSQTGL